MTFIICATVTAAFVYFTFAFVAHVVKGVCDRRHPVNHIADTEGMVEPTPKNTPVIVAEPEIQDTTVTNYVTKNIRELRAYIRENKLQEHVRTKLGKNVSQCSKGELIAAIA